MRRPLLDIDVPACVACLEDRGIDVEAEHGAPCLLQKADHGASDLASLPHGTFFCSFHRWFLSLLRTLMPLGNHRVRMTRYHATSPPDPRMRTTILVGR